MAIAGKAGTKASQVIRNFGAAIKNIVEDKVEDAVEKEVKATTKKTTTKKTTTKKTTEKKKPGRQRKQRGPKPKDTKAKTVSFGKTSTCILKLNKKPVVLSEFISS